MLFKVRLIVGLTGVVSAVSFGAMGGILSNTAS
jgi:hypothetical protein